METAGAFVDSMIYNFNVYIYIYIYIYIAGLLLVLGVSKPESVYVA